MKEQKSKGAVNREGIFVFTIGAGLVFFFLTGGLLISLLHGNWRILGGIDMFLAALICALILFGSFSSSYEIREKQQGGQK